jgi:signal peptidase I
MIYLAGVVGVLLVAYVSVDARRRGLAPFWWAVLVAATGPLGLIVYLAVRGSSPSAARPLGPRGVVNAVLEAIALVVLALIVLSWGTTVVAQVGAVSGHAMEPALTDGARVVINKLAYRWGNPRRGDVVMLYYPVNPDKLFVLRVIGDQGDLVRIDNGRVFVNDTPRADSEVAPDARSHDSWGPQMIPEGYYFVMGDRRNNSSDSRHWGMVPKKYILGRVAFRLF